MPGIYVQRDGVCQTDADYNTLEVSLGLPLANVDIYGFRGTDQGAKLKNSSGWATGENGTNTSGFSALPGRLPLWSGWQLQCCWSIELLVEYLY